MGTLLGGFSMSSAFSSFYSEWKSDYQKYSSVAAIASSIFFLCMVCISSLVVFIYSDIEYLALQNGISPSRNFLTTLAIANLALGFLGMASLLLVLGSLGWEKSKKLGLVSTALAIFAVVVLTWALITFCGNLLQGGNEYKKNEFSRFFRLNNYYPCQKYSGP